MSLQVAAQKSKLGWLPHCVSRLLLGSVLHMQQVGESTPLVQPIVLLRPPLLSLLASSKAAQANVVVPRHFPGGRQLPHLLSRMSLAMYST